MSLRFAHRAFTGGQPLPRAFAALNPVLPASARFLFEDVRFVTKDNDNQPQSAPVDGEVYVDVLRQFVAKGDLTVKEAPVYLARGMQMQYETLNAKGEGETTQALGRILGDRFLVFDPDFFTPERIDDFMDLIYDRAKKYEREARAGAPDFHAIINSGGLTPRTVTSAIGSWTMKEGDRKADYEDTPCVPGTCLYRPKQNPENYRICMQVDENVMWHANWGGFYVPKNGTLVMRVGTRDLIKTQLVEIDAAPEDKRAALIEEHFFTTDLKGKRLPRHDVWGMMPDFRKHYVNIEHTPDQPMRKLPKAPQSVLEL